MKPFFSQPGAMNDDEMRTTRYNSEDWTNDILGMGHHTPYQFLSHPTLEAEVENYFADNSFCSDKEL